MTRSVLETTWFDGPNAWLRAPALLARLDLDGRDDAGLAARLTAMLPLLADPSPSNAPLAPLPLPAGEGLAALLGALSLDLQRLAGIDAAFRVGRVGRDGAHELALECPDPVVGRAALELAADLIGRLRAGDEPSDDTLRALALRFGTLAASRRGGTAALAIAAAARARGIPIARIDPSGRILELRTGAWRRRVMGSLTSLTGKLAEAISVDKPLTNAYLRAAGLPVPDGETARTPAQAVAVAERLGFPVALKPADHGASAGVFVDRRTADEVRACFAAALAASPSGRVLVERHVAGVDCRVLIVDDRVIAAAEHHPASVTGDGARSVRALIAAANADPRRGPAEATPLKPIELDELTAEMLARAGLGLDDAPAAGRRVALKPTGKVPHGGIAIDRTDAIPPDNAAICRQAARALGADVASLDLVAPDLAQSIWATGGALLDVNLGSGFRNELHPGEGHARDPGPAIVEMLFPPGRPTRAAVVAVLADEAFARRIAETVAARLTAEGRRGVGLAAGEHVSVDGLTLRGDGARTLLAHPLVETAVVAVTAAEIVARGLGFDACDVAAIAARSGLTTPDGRPVEAVLAELAGPSGALIVNGGDPTLATLGIAPTGFVAAGGLTADAAADLFSAAAASALH